MLVQLQGGPPRDASSLPARLALCVVSLHRPADVDVEQRDEQETMDAADAGDPIGDEASGSDNDTASPPSGALRAKPLSPLRAKKALEAVLRAIVKPAPENRVGVGTISIRTTQSVESPSTGNVVKLVHTLAGRHASQLRLASARRHTVLGAWHVRRRRVPLLRRLRRAALRGSHVRRRLLVPRLVRRRRVRVRRGVDGCDVRCAELCGRLRRARPVCQ
jgi:hypothetical protein